MLQKLIFSITLLSFTFQLNASTHPDLIVNETNGESCMQCHTPHTDSWKKTKHFASKDILIDSKKASDILNDLGSQKSVLEDENCTTCHFTTKKVDQKVTPILGISCESCHGAAKDWVSIHQHSSIKDFMSYDINKIEDEQAKAKFTETKAKVAKLNDEASFKKLIYETTKSLGMIRSTDTYYLIENCYQCHTVPEPELLNKTKHKAGSSFEIIRYLTGDVLHHYKGENEKGAPVQPLSLEKKRELYVSGIILFLENSLRALDKGEFAEGEKKGSKYFEKMLLRTRRGIDDLIELDENLGGAISEVAELAKTFKPYEGKQNVRNLSKAQLPKLIELTKKNNLEFLENHAGSAELSKLDSVLEKIKTIKPYK